MNLKVENLKNWLAKRKRLCIALSGGLDSSVLLGVASGIIKKGDLIALIAQSDYMMRGEIESAINLCKSFAVDFKIIKFEIPEFLKDNPKNRCYLCKKHIFSTFKQWAVENDFDEIADGTNLDDLSDFRPGMLALKELGISSPFLECQIGKKEICELSDSINLKISKASYACLMTRFAHNCTVDKNRLANVDLAEEYLRHLGFEGVRIRSYLDSARIELRKEDIKKTVEMSSNIVGKLKELGFKNISVDLEGYKKGSMNEK